MQGGQGGMGGMQSSFSRIPQGGGMPMGNPAMRGGFQGTPAMRGGYGQSANTMPYYPQGGFQPSGANTMAGGDSAAYHLPRGGGIQLAPGMGLLGTGGTALGGGDPSGMTNANANMYGAVNPAMGNPQMPMPKVPGMGVPMPKPGAPQMPPGMPQSPQGGAFGFGGPMGGSPMGQPMAQPGQPQRTGTWLDDYMQQGQDASQQGLAPNLTGSQNGMNFINGRLFAGQGLNSGGNDFSNIMQAYGPQMRNLGIMR